MASIDAKTFKAVNGDDGGTWAPAAPIVVGGSGMTVKLVGVNQLASGVLYARSSSIVHFDSGSTLTMDLGSSIFADGAATFSGDFVGHLYGFLGIESGGQVRFQIGSVLNMQNGSNGFIGGNIQFDGNSVIGSFGTNTFGSPSVTTFSAGSTLNLSGTTTVNGASCSFGTIPSFLAGATCRNKISMQSAGRIVRAPVVGATSGGGTASPTIASLYYFGTVSADQTYTIDDTNAADGDELEFYTNSATNTVIINDPLSVELQRIKNATGSYLCMRVTRISGSWKLTSITKA